MWEVFWFISNENQVSVSQALWSWHKVTKGWRKRSIYLRGLMGGRIGWNSRSRFSIKSQLKVSQGYMNTPLALLKMKILIHLSIESSKEPKRADVFIKHDQGSPILARPPVYHTLSLWDVRSPRMSLHLRSHTQLSLIYALPPDSLLEFIKDEHLFASAQCEECTVALVCSLLTPGNELSVSVLVLH